MKLDKFKKNVCVVFGGKSVEHDISIITGVQVIHGLDEKRFNIIPIYITKDEKWLTGENFKDIKNFSIGETSGDEVCLFNKSLYKVLKKKQKYICDIDFVFLALHGNKGENGAIQGYLEVVNIPFSSSGVLGSGITMNKLATKLCAYALNLPTCKYITLFADDKDNFDKLFNDRISSNLSFPLIVKPNSLGSSIGISFCKTKQELQNAISFAFMFDDVVLVEEVVQNLRELNISVLGNSLNQEISVIEDVTSKKDFLTFENKYLNSSDDANLKGMENLDRTINIQLTDALASNLEEYSKKIFKYFSLSGCIRIDYLYDELNNILYLNEINSIPGSMANYLWREKYSFKGLLNKMFDYAIEEYELKNKKISNFSSSVLNQFASCSKINFNGK